MASLLRSSLTQLRGLTRVSNVNQIASSTKLSSRAYSMSFTFASPYEVHYKDADVKQVDVPSFSGTFGILPQHVPTLAVLKPGVVTVFENEGDTKKYFVSSGTVTINEDSSVQILAEEAVPLDFLDVNAARDALKDAQTDESKASSPEEKAAAQVAVEVSEAIIKAIE
ncbi:ATP synthase subunit delta, mitochondrial [Tetranychus urticae]|uniref:F-ATPase delta subunit n=1 Tax=Tetranychus urticae TaxID=32264 RepID=T1KH68_TETUR|nr:ATP synthase subunit delta, mitochondrial [Tetranychus urticae]